MAFADDLQSFIESRLQAYDPTMDLSAGSPAQIQIVQPIVDKLAEDPFATDIPTFIRDRLVQEFPELIGDNGGMLEDMFTKPMQLILEPLKREIQSVKLNQSVRDAELLSEDEADALGANWYTRRKEGDFSSGMVRVYYAAPTTSRITADRVFTSASGLVYYPIQTYFLAATQMAFNREGSLYYIDITVQAEKAGDAYNVKKGEISSVDDVPGVIKVANLSEFISGQPRQTNAEYLGLLEQSLTERSLGTKRGAFARTMDLFNGVRSMQVVGAGETGMDRDIIKGTGQGYAHLVAHGAVYGTWVVTDEVYYKDLGPAHNYSIQAGDTVRFVVGADTHEGVVSRVFTGSDADRIFIIMEEPFDGFNSGEGALSILKPGFITISDVPGGMANDITVPDDQVHIGGHVDVFVRPTEDSTQLSELSNITDEAPLVSALDFLVVAPNRVTNTAAIDYAARGVKAGQLLVLEEGDAYAGTYHILEVDGTSVRIDQVFTVSSGELRGRVMANIQVKLNEPRILKLPFGEVEANNLQTVVGSNLFQFVGMSVQDYGAAVGDVIRVLDGPDAGDFNIVSFDPSGVVVDVAAGATGSSLRYELFTKFTGLTFPLVRLKTLEMLDSTGQATGITVPYGDAVDGRPTIGMEGAGTEFKVLSRDLLIFPDAEGLNGGYPYWYSPPGTKDEYCSALPAHDTRYSQKLTTADGVVRIASFEPANTISEAEINLPPFLWNGRNDKVLAFCTEPDPEFTTTAIGNHRTSPLARGKIGDSLELLDGPNQGKYLIRDIRILDLWGKSAATRGHYKIALIQLDQEMKSDPIRTAMRIIEAEAGTPVTDDNLISAICWASDWDNASGFWLNLLIPRLRTAFASMGIAFTAEQLAALMDPQIRCSYSTGPSAHGDLRLYFLDPVSLELYSGDEPTLFEVLTDVSKRFRLDPWMEPAQIYPESEVATAPTAWNRNGLSENTITDPAYAILGGSSFASKGIQTGDILEYHAAINDLQARGYMSSSWMCVTQAGTSVVQLIYPNTDEEGSFLNPTLIEAGQLFFIETGPDVGAYVITEVIEDELLDPPVGPTLPTVKIRLDRTLSHTTLSFPADARFVTVTCRGETDKVYAPTSDTIFDGVAAGDYITLYLALAGQDNSVWESGVDAPYQGTFRVSSCAIETDGSAFNGRRYVQLEKDDFPTYDAMGELPNGDTEVYCLLHEAPDDVPADTSRGGKEITTQFVRFRLYHQLPTQATITIPWTLTPNPLVAATPLEYVRQIELSTSLQPVSYNYRTPYRVLRESIYRLSSSTMSKNREGALYYADVPVVGLGPSSSMNIGSEIALGLAGNYRVDGYRLVVENPVLSYSIDEKVDIILPTAVLPVGSTPALDNTVHLAGQTIRVSYDVAPLIEEIQGFFDSPQDRILISNALIRHFLPAYVFLDLGYVGGSEEALVAGDLISLINNIPPDTNQLAVDAVIKTVQLRGATQVSNPITLIALVHGSDRRVRGIRSQNLIGAGQERTFEGTYQQMYFIAGPDTSKEDPRPTGEQVFLFRF